VLGPRRRGLRLCIKKRIAADHLHDSVNPYLITGASCKLGLNFQTFHS
jgi:hypothetical protein